MKGVRMKLSRGTWRTVLALVALSLLGAQGARAEWNTVLLTKDLVYAGGINGVYSGLWGTNPNNVYAAGAGGIIHFDGKRWARETVALPPSSGFQGIWGSGASDIYAIGNHGLVQDTVQGPLVYHFDGKRWVNLWPQMAAALPRGFSNTVLSRIGGTGRDDVYVSGRGSLNDDGYGYALLLHYDGSRWSPALLEKGLFIWDILVQGRAEVYAVGHTMVLISPQKGATSYAAIRRFNGREWRDLSSAFNIGPGSDFSTIAAIGPGNIFLAGRLSEGGGSLESASLFFRGDGSNWQGIDPDGSVRAQRLLVCNSRLYGIVYSRTGYMRRNSSTPLLAYWENGQWHIIPLHGETDPESAWGADGHLFVVGHGRQIFHFDGQGNIEAPAPLDDGRGKPPATKLEELEF